MKRRRLGPVLGAVVSGVTLSLAIVTLGWGDDRRLALMLIALTPMIFLAFHLAPELFADNASARALDGMTSPLSSACLALSFFALAVVVGSGLGDWPGGLIGGGVGLVLAVQSITSMRSVRRVMGLEHPSRVEVPRKRPLIAATALGVVALVALLAGFGYLLGGRTGAIVLVVLNVVFVTTTLLVGLRERGKDA